MKSEIKFEFTADLAPEVLVSIAEAVKAALPERTHLKVVDRPLFPKGLDPEGVRRFYEGLTSKQRCAVRDEVNLWLRLKMDEADADTLWGEDPDSWPFVIGGRRVFTVDSEEYEDAEDALKAAGYVKGEGPDWTLPAEDEDEEDTLFQGEEEALADAVERDLIYAEKSAGDYAGPRPAQNLVRVVEFLPGDSGDEEQDAQAVHDFTGMLVYDLGNHERLTGYVLGIDGGGYSFFEPHLLPLAYLYGWLS